MSREVPPSGLKLTEEDLSGPRIDRRTSLKLLGAAGLGSLTSLAGCSGNGGDDGNGGDESGDGTNDGDGGDSGGDTNEMMGGRLSLGYNANEINQIDPHYSTLTFSSQIMGNFFSGLLEIKEDYTVQGDLAEDWEVMDGGETITFQLVDNASFHNGNSFTAEDVRYSVDRVINEDTAHQNKFATLQPVGEGGVVVDSDYQVTFNFEEPFAPILIFLTPGLGNAGAIVSQEAIEEMGADQYGITPVGTGPFAITEHELGSTMVLDAHDGYHKTDDDGNQLPYLDGIDVEPIKEASTRVNALRTGDVQMLNWVPSANADQLEQDDAVTLLRRMGPNFGGLAFNTNVEPFDDRRVRRAIAKALDEERYVEEALLGAGIADTGIYSPAHEWVYRDEFGDAPDQKPPDQQYDPEGARELAEEADAIGLEVEMMVSQPELRGARVLRTLLDEELDWTVELDVNDFATIFERLENENYDLIPWGNSVAPDPDVLTYGVFGPPDDSGNYWAYEDEDLLDLLVQQRRQLDREARAETLWKVEDHIITEAPWALLEHEEALTAHRSVVQNYTNFGVILRLRDVWLSE